MALIKNISEIRAVIPRMSKLSDSANLPNVDKAARMHIVPIIGIGLYNDLDAKFNTNIPAAPTEKELNLIKQIQLPLAAFALLDDLPFLHTSITDNGLRTANTETLPAAHKWEFKGVQDALISYAADGIEILLEYLYQNKVDFNLWVSSEAYEEFNSCLIRTGSDFSKYYHLTQPQRTFWQLKAIMIDVEENFLSSKIGGSLLDWIKSQDKVLYKNKGEEIDVKKLLKKAAAYLTIKMACEHLPVTFTDSGFTILAAGGDPDGVGSVGKQAANNLQIKMDAASREGNNFLERASYLLTAMTDESYTEEVSEGFTTAYENSPLYMLKTAEPFSNGNDRRKIFRF